MIQSTYRMCTQDNT